jgi:hypothetical protein
MTEPRAFRSVHENTMRMADIIADTGRSKSHWAVAVFIKQVEVMSKKFL